MTEQAETPAAVRFSPKSIVLTVPADEKWIEYLTQHGDIFGRTYYCGYWMSGREHHKKRGWLAYECGDDRPPHATPRDVLKAWRNGHTLPVGWHRIDRDLALRAQAEAVKLRGVDWQDNADGPFYDCIVQRALFGEEKYG